MRHSWIAIAALAACSGGKPAAHTLAITSTMTVIMQSGAGPSPLDPLDGQDISVDVTFDLESSDMGYDTPTECNELITDETGPMSSASGATADLVTSQILAILPEWDARLSLCNPTSASSAELHSDNQAGLGVIFSCTDLPSSAMQADGQMHPEWSSFTVSACSATIYDQLHARLFGATNIQMMFAVR